VVRGKFLPVIFSIFYYNLKLCLRKTLFEGEGSGDDQAQLGIGGMHTTKPRKMGTPGLLPGVLKKSGIGFNILKIEA
jgi:hypothetical protein